MATVATASDLAESWVKVSTGAERLDYLAGGGPLSAARRHEPAGVPETAAQRRARQAAQAAAAWT